MLVEGRVVSSIENGLLVLLGVKKGDTETACQRLAERTARLRIFQDDAGKFNLSLLDIKGSALVVSQFTLLADTRRGRRPSFTDAEEPGRARELYERFISALRESGIRTEAGVFGAHMNVILNNDGPVTIILED